MVVGEENGTSAEETGLVLFHKDRLFLMITTATSAGTAGSTGTAGAIDIFSYSILAGGHRIAA